jgi:hypothetical protein
VKTIHDRLLERSVSRERRSRQFSMDVRDHIKPTYYMKSLQYHYALKDSISELTKKYKEHMVQSLASIRYLKKIRPPSMENITKSRMQLAKLDSVLESSRRG